MQKIGVLAFFLALSCQTKINKKTIQPVNPQGELQKSNAFGSIIDPSKASTCLRVENCSSGIDTPTLCGQAIEDTKLVVGAEGCKLKLVSFEFTQQNQKITLSPEEREKLANVAEGEGIPIQVQIGNAVFLMNIKAMKKLAARIDSDKINPQYLYNYVQFSKEVKVSDVDIKATDSRFLGACENTSPQIPLSIGEQNLLRLVKIMSQGLSCRDKYQSLLQTQDLFLYNLPGTGTQELDFTLLAEFPNIKKIAIDGYFPLTFANDQKFEQLTISHSNGARTLNFPHDWFNKSTNWSVKNLYLDHIVFADSFRPISDAIPDHVEHLFLKNIVHLNFSGLDKVRNIQALTIQDTYIFDEALFVEISTRFNVRNITTQGVHDFFSLPTINSKKKSDTDCQFLKGLEECLFNQCIWSTSDGCLYSEALPSSCNEFTAANYCNRLNLCNWKNTNVCDEFGNAHCGDFKLRWKCLMDSRCRWDTARNLCS